MNESKTWIEITIPCDAETIEAIGNFLFELGCQGLEEYADFIRGYFPGMHGKENLATSLYAYLENIRNLGFTVGTPVFKDVNQEDWSVEWRKYFKPIPIDSRVLVKPPWETWKGPQTIVVDIMPRMAFGTGTHETTQLCVTLIEDHLQAHDVVMDIGTGSGVLAIVAAKLAAAKIVAMDIHWEAMDNARENMKQNGVDEKILLFFGSLDALRPMAFDLIIANINRTVLERLLPKLREYTHDQSWLILSGILVSEHSQMQTFLTSLNFRIQDQRQKGEWMAYGLQINPS